MPRAIDPSLPAGGLPITHSPLNRVRFNVIPQKLDMQAITEQVLGLDQKNEAWLSEIEDFVVPLINQLFTIDLSSWFDFLEGFSTQTGAHPTDVAQQAENNAAQLQATWDSIVQAAGNLIESGFGLEALFASISDHTTQITDLNAGVAALRADQQAQIVSGKSFTIHFNAHPNATSPPNIFTKVLDTGAGSVITAGGLLEWSGGSVIGREFYRYNVEPLLTDYFEVSMIMPMRSQMGLLGDTGNAYQYLLGRMNTAGTTTCVGRVGRKTMRVGCIVAGLTTMANPTWFGSNADVEAPAGSYVTFRGGTSVANVRVFQMLVNNNVKATFIDSANTSAVSTAHRFTGFGFEADNVFLAGYIPGNMSTWTANDNQQPAVVGSVARMYRAATTNVAMVGTSTATQTLPNNFFSVIDHTTPDITTSLTDGSFTVSRDGTYQIRMRAQAATAFRVINTAALTKTITPLVYVNSVIREYGPPISAAVDAVLTPLGATALYGSWELYLHAGEKVQVGYRNDEAMDVTTWGQLVGEASGAKTYLTISLLNWNTL